MTEEEIRRIVRETVRETLTGIGINSTDDGAILEAQKDAAWVRQSRIGSQELGRWVKRAVIGVAVSALLYMVWDGLKLAIRAKVGG